MATDNQNRSRDQREQDKQAYHNTPDARYQPDRNRPGTNHGRPADDDGDATQDFNTIADDGTSDGVASTIAGSGANNGGPGGRIGHNTQSPAAEGTKGAGTVHQDQLRTPSAQSQHQNQGDMRNDADHGQSGQAGSRSGRQV